ncbi:MAG TPA: translation initiation factor [Bacteroidia bacterium]|nr:translation initiation factor [Bacteroidia bacterium]HNT80976.1 translation initiation factor [Bacteroidia bacterium]
MSSKKNKGGFVYSTNPDFKPIDQEEKTSSIKASEQDLRIWRESKNRGGKTVTIVKGYIGPDEEMIEIAKKLKNLCGCGGTVKDGEIIIQGDFRQKVTEYLNKQGYKAKMAG